jgi:hypothetical protein
MYGVRGTMAELRAADGLRYPNLLIAGFLKCGTTSLAKYLSDHPDVARPVAKELYYLIDETSDLRSIQSTINNSAFAAGTNGAAAPAYLDFFPDRAGRRYAIDATPFYYSQDTAIQYAQTHPDVRVIFMVRTPEKRLASSFQYFQNVLQEYPDGSFDAFAEALLDHGPKRDAYRARIKKPFFRKLFDDELEMGNYDKHISRWISAVGKDRVFIGQSEALGENPHRFMTRICDFLDIDDDFYRSYQFRLYLRSYRVRLPFVQKLGRKLARTDALRYDRMTEFQGLFYRVPVEWLRSVCDLAYGTIQRASSAKPFSPEAMRQLRAYYDEANRALKARYGIDYLRTDHGAGAYARRAADSPARAVTVPDKELRLVE